MTEALLLDTIMCGVKSDRSDCIFLRNVGVLRTGERIFLIFSESAQEVILDSATLTGGFHTVRLIY